MQLCELFWLWAGWILDLIIVLFYINTELESSKYFINLSLIKLIISFKAKIPSQMLISKKLENYSLSRTINQTKLLYRWKNIWALASGIHQKNVISQNVEERDEPLLRHLEKIKARKSELNSTSQKTNSFTN